MFLRSPGAAFRKDSCGSGRPRRAANWLSVLGLCLAAVLTGPGTAQATTHTVGKGQSLWKIAKRYNVSVDDIRSANGLTKGDPIQPGQKLEIPDGKGSSTKKQPAPKKSGGKKAGVHVVGQGDSLWKIADKYDVTVSELRDANNIPKGKALQPGQELTIPGGSAAAAPSAPAEAPTKAAHWVLEKPGASTQTQKSPEARGGVNPCLTQDPGYGIYDHWNRNGIRMGGALIPQKGGVTSSGSFDVVFHFHGHDPARKEFVRVADGAVFVGVTLGIGSGVYSSSFSSPAVFEGMIADVEKMVAQKTGKKNARVRKIGLTAWSAGYGAVEQILSQKAGKKVDTVILLDGLHSGYGQKTLDENQLKPFVEFAKQARAGQKFMFVSHSSIIPPGYASTTETANYLIHKLGGKPKTAKPRNSDPMGLELIARYDRGNFHVRGYRGNDKMDHCAHIGLLKDVFKVHIKPRWRSPRGRKK